jgi:hypothetical protein
MSRATAAPQPCHSAEPEPQERLGPSGECQAQALFTHHHYGWKQHTLPGDDEQSLLSALLETHGFLEEYGGRYRVEICRTPEYSFRGVVGVYWDSNEPKTFVFGAPLSRGDYWFKAFEFNVADRTACRYCGGTGVDHYVGPFFHCWACDGTARQVREGTFRGFKHKPIARDRDAAEGRDGLSGSGAAAPANPARRDRHD